MENRIKQFLIIAGFLSIGFAIRLYPFYYENIINLDGVKYINQARTILEGNWDQVINCGFEFISIYHLLIPVFYKIFGDWIIAAKSISLLFGTLTIVPFYLISKQFFRTSTTLIATLAFSINPFFVSHSEDLIKGPIFWFFALLGMYFFLRVVNEKGKNQFLLFSSVSFLIAGWARFEVIIYIAVSALYIFFSKKEKIKKFFLFCLPFLIFFIVAIFGFFLYQQGLSVWSLYLEPRVMIYIGDFSYNVLNEDIFKKSVVGIISILNRLSRVIYIPFLLVLIPGFWEIKKQLKRNPHFVYFIFLSSLSLLALFLFYLKTETMVDRYAAFVVLPTFIFICSGVERIRLFLKSRRYQEKYIILALCFYIIFMVIAFPQNLVHRRKDQVVYEDIGKHIARIEDNRQVKVIGPDSRIVLFANLYSEGIECVNNNLEKYVLFTEMNYQEMVSVFKEKKIKYFIWEERRWNNASYDFVAVAKTEHFREIMHWETKKKNLRAFKMLYD